MRQGRRVRRSPGPSWTVPALLGLLLILTAATAAVALGRSSGSGAEPPPEGPKQIKDMPVRPPEPEPEPEPEPTIAEMTLAQMTLHEKVCQLFIVFPKAITGTDKVTAAGDATRKALEQYPVGGFLYDRTNLVTQEQTRDMLTGVQTMARVPLLLTCDEEGGRVNRLMRGLGTTYFGPMLSYKDQGPETARSNASSIGKDMQSLGFNMDLAPVADVWSNPANTVIGDRAYSDDFAQASELVAAAVEGFHDGGVACVLKHFPGHGDTSGDSHYGSVYVYKTLDELRSAELLPFQAGIRAGADAVMMGHLIVAEGNENNQPALMSYDIVTGLLRRELGFGGVVMTDSLQMQAIIDHYSSAEIAVGAIQAGVDILLCPYSLSDAAAAIEAAVDAGEITMERLDESVLRILTLKESRGILTSVPEPLPETEASGEAEA